MGSWRPSLFRGAAWEKHCIISWVGVPCGVCVWVCMCVGGHPRSLEGQDAKMASFLWLPSFLCVWLPPSAVRPPPCLCLWDAHHPSCLLIFIPCFLGPSQSAACSLVRAAAFLPLSIGVDPEPLWSMPGLQMLPIKRNNRLLDKMQHLYREQLLFILLRIPPYLLSRLSLRKYSHFAGKEAQRVLLLPSKWGDRECWNHRLWNQRNSDLIWPPLASCVTLVKSLTFSGLSFSVLCSDNTTYLSGLSMMIKSTTKIQFFYKELIWFLSLWRQICLFVIFFFFGSVFPHSLSFDILKPKHSKPPVMYII